MSREVTTFGRIAVATLATLLLVDTASANEDLFRRQVAPIFEQHCVRCHQGDQPKGGLSLIHAKFALVGGESGPLIDLKEPGKSVLLEMISRDPPEMPKAAPALSPVQVAMIRKWIEQGAKWPDDLVLVERKTKAADEKWWSLQPIASPAIPVIDAASASPLAKWPRTPIDHFILAKHLEKKFTPAPEADRRTLIRRLSFDLHGLPPTPEEIDAFVADTDPQAYEKLVDRLLASPRYGEQWGRHWLDVVHYGDTHGYDKDKRRNNAWPYRDYVIRALNEDKPYGRFLVEQVAGDVLAPNNPATAIATGFIAAGPWDFVGHVELREGTVDKQITRLLDRDDMLANTMSTFASVTIHCARCHDHPFDPFTQQDYYRLQADFAGVDRGDRPYDDAQTYAKRSLVEARRTEITAKLATIAEQAKRITSPDLQKLEAQLASLIKQRDALSDPLASAAPSPTNGYHSNISGTQDVTKWVQIDLGESKPIDAINLVPARPTDFRDAPGFGFPLRFQVAISDEPTFAQPRVIADHLQNDYPNPGDVPVSFNLTSSSTELPTARYVRVTATRLWQRSNDFVFALAEMQIDSQGKNIAAGAKVMALDSIEAGRWNKKHLVDGFSSRRTLSEMADPASAETHRQRDELAEQVIAAHRERETLIDSLLNPQLRDERSRLTAELTRAEQDAKKLPPQKMFYGLVTHPPREIHVLHRGDVKNSRDLIGPGAIAGIQGLPAEFVLSNPEDEGQRRLALANWLADPRNPLTWRSIVNRVWHYHFGQGIVDSPNDFGHMGSRPTHPELLDRLAAEFLVHGQSLKWLHKQIVMSAVYRQSSSHPQSYAASDSSNQYLWRMNRRRLPAESIRDATLAASGKLDLTMGGPGFDLFGFKDDHSPRYEYDKHDVDAPDSLRRSVYRFVVRSVPDPFMECLDCADPSQNVPVRTETITPLQALVLLNNPLMVRQAEHLAARVQQNAKDIPRQIAAAYRWTLGRSPSREESSLLVQYVERHGLANMCRLLLNSNEFVFVD